MGAVLTSHVGRDVVDTVWRPDHSEERGGDPRIHQSLAFLGPDIVLSIGGDQASRKWGHISGAPTVLSGGMSSTNGLPACVSV